MKNFISITKSLADKNRIRILMALRGQPLCVCQITELLKLAPSTVSKHLAILKQARMIDCVKVGRWIFYCLDKSESLSSGTISWLENSLLSNSEIEADRKRLDEILKMDAEELCRKQKCNSMDNG